MMEWFLHRYQRLRIDPIDMDTTICYNETPYGPAVPCTDLPKWLHKLNVATWSPIGKTLHLCEWLMATISFVTLMPILLGKYKGLTKRKKWARRPLPIVYLVAACYHMYKYKCYHKLPQIGWATTPCHLGWIIRFTMHWVPLPEVLQDWICQVLLNYTSLAFLFIFEDGEVGDAMYDGVWTWSLIHHLLLITIPGWDLYKGRVVVMPPPPEKPGQPEKWTSQNFIRWHTVSVCTYLFMYVTCFTPVSLMSGVNWGWTIHFHATKVAEEINLTGKSFRLWWLLYYNILFVLFRAWWLGFEILLRGSGFGPYADSVVQERHHKYLEEEKKKEQEGKAD